MALAAGSDAYKAASAKQCLIMSTEYAGKELLGFLDLGQVYYVDPFHTGAQPFLEQSLPPFYTLVGGYDGLQI